MRTSSRHSWRAYRAACASAIVSSFDKIRNHFGVSRVSQAGALAALRDAAYLAETQQKVEFARGQLEQCAKAHGLTPLRSATNFVTMDCGAAVATQGKIDDSYDVCLVSLTRGLTNRRVAGGRRHAGR